MHFRRTTGALIAGSVLTLTAACGSSDSTGSMSGMDHGSTSSSTSSTTPAAGASQTSTATASQHNNADVQFATQMIPHHQQAVMMAQLAPSRAGSEEVKTLANQIAAAQGPEISTMSNWLKSWGQPVPESMQGMDGAEGMDHDMGSMGGGMMSATEMSQLEQAEGTAFDVAFLKGMTKHHQGAVAMAETEARDGQNTAAKQLAQSIVTSQTNEISQMQQLLTKLKG